MQHTIEMIRIGLTCLFLRNGFGIIFLNARKHLNGRTDGDEGSPPAQGAQRDRPRSPKPRLVAEWSEKRGQWRRVEPVGGSIARPDVLSSRSASSTGSSNESVGCSHCGPSDDHAEEDDVLHTLVRSKAFECDRERLA